MSSAQAVELCRAAAVVSLLIAAPVLICAVVVGLTISIAQAVTQLQDQTLSFVPKIIAMGVVLLYVMPWAMGQMTNYSMSLIEMIPQMIVR